MLHDKLQIDSPLFWSKRYEEAKKEGQLFKSLWYIDEDEWNRVNQVHKNILHNILDSDHTISVIDIGCGIGTVSELIPNNVKYIGIDFVSEFIAEARKQYPSRTFVNMDARNIRYSNKRFDFAICRSFEGMIKYNLGVGIWRDVEKEIMRVANRVIYIGYSNPEIYLIADCSEDMRQYSINKIIIGNSYLTYRAGQDGTIEIYDLLVEESQRRKGIASRMLDKLIKETYGCVYAFTRITNMEAQGFYENKGFEKTIIPKFYRGIDGVMYTLSHMKIEEYKND